MAQKVTVKQCIILLSEFECLRERTVQKTGEVLKPVVIPSEKSKAGYWLGKLEDKCASIKKTFAKQQEKLIIDLGEPIMVEKKNEKGVVESVDSGNKQVKAENMSKYTEAIDQMYEVEEEISFLPLDYELIEGIAFPQSFWSAIFPFISEPVKK